MVGYLLDTNVLSELIRKRPSKSLLERLRRVPPADLSTSAICVTELRFGAARHPTGESLWNRIRTEILSRVRIVPFGEEEAMVAGQLLADLESRGERIGVEDVLIASTAKVRGLTVVTRNLKHFARVEGLKVEVW